jgi:hypothetical protein
VLGLEGQSLMVTRMGERCLPALTVARRQSD